MTEAAFALLPEDLRDGRFRKNFAELSKTHPKPGDPIAYCIPPGSPRAALQAVEFDAVKEHYYKVQLPFLNKSADALYIHQDEWFLIEFKTGGAPVWGTVRKAYDSVITLFEHDILSLADCREKLTFILVRENAKKLFPYYDLGKMTEKNYGPKWEYDVADISASIADADPRVLTGQIAKKVYVMDVPDFVGFSSAWTN